MIVREVFDLAVTEGEIGIEIEAEGVGLARIRVPRGWRLEGDGSLRDNGVEYVLRQPVRRERVFPKCKDLLRAIEQEGAEVEYTGRAGVHVHVNVQELTMTQTYNFICAYMIFEDILLDFCGDDRVGNLFCLRVRDAEALVDKLREALQEDNFMLFNDNEYRYAGINITALGKYGSLEFRAMRSTVDPDVIDQWVKILCALKDWAIRFDNPVQIIEALSMVGPAALFREVFGPDSALKYDEGAMYDGVRQAQYVAYTPYPWSSTLKEQFFEIQNDPLIEYWHEYRAYQRVRDEWERVGEDVVDFTIVRNLMQLYKMFQEKEFVELDRRALRDAARDMEEGNDPEDVHVPLNRHPGWVRLDRGHEEIQEIADRIREELRDEPIGDEDDDDEEDDEF